MNHKLFGVIIILAIVFLRVLVACQLLDKQDISIQQDNYASYAHSLKTGNVSFLSEEDKQLFPGYPVMIRWVSVITGNEIYAGIIINIAASITVAGLLWIICKSKIPVMLSVFFPPIWVKLGGKIATEPLFAATALASIYLFIKKKYFWAGLVSGCLFVIRPIGLMLVFTLLILGKRRQILKGFVIPVLLLIIFNYLVFGDGLQQFMHLERYGGIRLGIVQIWRDLYRTLDWGQYRIFLSGLFYLAVNMTALFGLWTKRKQTILIRVLWLWMVMSLAFILTFSPETLIDDFGRYSMAVVPAQLIGISLMLKKYFQADETNIEGIFKKDPKV